LGFQIPLDHATLRKEDILETRIFEILLETPGFDLLVMGRGEGEGCYCAVNAFLGRGIAESLIFSLALAVGIIPEALPVIITIGLSDGAIRLAHKKVVVKRLEAKNIPLS
jgi:hypothetical protein